MRCARIESSCQYLYTELFTIDFCKDFGDPEKYADLAQQNGFGTAFLQSLQRLIKGVVKCNIFLRRVINMI